MCNNSLFASKMFTTVEHTNILEYYVYSIVALCWIGFKFLEYIKAAFAS